MLKEIRVIIGEENFDIQNVPEEVDGYAVLEKDSIFLRKPMGNILLHELIHLLEFDERTKPVVIDLFNDSHIKPLTELMKQPDFLEYVAEYYDNYKPEVWESEVLAYHLQFDLIEEFGSPKEAIRFLNYWVWKQTGISVILLFTDINLNIIDLD